MRRVLYFLFKGPAWLTFVMMGVFAGFFALTSYNLLRLFMANFDFVKTYGWMGLMDGGLVQLLELAIYGYLSLGFYILFKGCLDGLLARVLRH